MLKDNRRAKGLIGLVAIGAFIALVVGCTPSHAQSTFDALGPVAKSQLDLFWITFWVGLVVFILVEGAILYIAFRYKRKPDDSADPAQTHGSTRLEIIWTVIPAILLLVVAVPTVQTVFANLNTPAPPPGEVVERIEAIGHQWWFEFRYPEHGVVTANELHIPVDTIVEFKLKSVDVIHSFWVPKLGGKVDMVPNNENSMWLQANEPGLYFGQCAEFCGVSHANMRFKVVAESREDYDAWLLAQAANAVVPIDPLVQEGMDLFGAPEAGCTQCHTIQGNRSARGRVGPDLSHVASRRHLAAGIMDNTGVAFANQSVVPDVNVSILQDNLRAWITDPESIKSGNIMSRDAAVYNGTLPELTDRQISALVAYLTTLK